MTTNLYKPVLLGAFLMAFSGMPGFGQYYAQQAYQDQGNSGQQLDNLVAPIALYPDSLLSQVLVASTYPQQLAEASQWLAQTGYLQGQQRLEAAQQQNWDPSVQALVAFPDVLQRLTQDPRWTADLGNAFLNNQSAVMSAVQDLRQRAQQSGRLQSTPQQTVNIQNYDGQPAIEIAPANPEVVYVPTYDPAYIWGAPAYGYYPQLSYPSWGFGFGGGISIGAFFGGYRGGYGGWGWGPSWRNRTVIVNNDFFYRNRFNGYRDGRYAGGSNVWRHDFNRGDSFSRGFAGNQQNYGGRGAYNSQQAYSNNYRQQGFRSNQAVIPQQQYSRQQFSQPQYSRQQYSQTQSLQQQYSRQQFSQPQYSRQQFSQPQYSQPRGFQQAQQQQYSPSRSFETRALQQQYSRPQNSQPQTQRYEQRNSSRNDMGRGQVQQSFASRSASPQSDRQSSFTGGRNRR